MDENRARDATQSSTASGQSWSVPSGSGPGLGGLDRSCQCNCYYVVGKNGRLAFDGSILPSIDPKNTARLLFCAPPNCSGRVKGGKICWENCRVCCARFFRGRLEEHRTRRAEEGVEKLRRKFVKLVKLRRLLQLFV